LNFGFVGGRDRLVKSFPSGFEISAQKSLEEGVSLGIVGVEGFFIACLKEVGQGANQSFLVGGIRAKWEDRFAGDGGCVGDRCMLEFDGLVLVLREGGASRIGGCLTALVGARNISLRWDG
jgi:hypothetical protein